MTQPVGEKKPNPWGLYDMYGNTWEWCADFYADTYTAGDQTDPVGPSSGSKRVLRGGSWSGNPASLRSSFRNGSDPAHRVSRTGLRCVLVVAAH